MTHPLSEFGVGVRGQPTCSCQTPTKPGVVHRNGLPCYLAEPPSEREEAIRTLTERRNWLSERIKAKMTVGWETKYDERERDSLTLILDEVSGTGDLLLGTDR